MSPKNNKRVWIAIGAVLLLVPMSLCALGGVVFNHVRLLSRSTEELGAAADEYRAADYCWEASDCKGPIIPKDQNAFPLLVEADQNAYWRILRLKEIHSAIDKGDYAKAEQGLARFQKGLAIVRKESFKPHLDPGQDPDYGMANNGAAFWAIRVQMAALCAEAEVEDGMGRFPDACEDLSAARRLARLSVELPTLFGVYVSLDGDKMVAESIERIGAHHATDVAGLQKLEDIFYKYHIHLDLTRSMKTDAYYDLASLRNLRGTWCEDLESRYLKPAHGTLNEPPARTGFPEAPSSGGRLTRVLQVWTEYGKILEANKDSYTGRVLAENRLAHSLDEEQDPSYSVAKQVMAGILYCEPSGQEAGARDLCVFGLLKALEYRAVNGAFPRSVSQLAGSFKDPCKPSELLKIRRKAGEFRIYSVSIDTKDNGGAELGELGAMSQGSDIAAAYPPIKRTVRLDPGVTKLDLASLTTDLYY